MQNKMATTGRRMRAFYVFIYYTVLPREDVNHWYSFKQIYIFLQKRNIFPWNILLILFAVFSIYYLFAKYIIITIIRCHSMGGDDRDSPVCAVCF